MKVWFLLITFSLFGSVELGVEQFIKAERANKYKTASIGLITNHTGLDASGRPTLELLQEAGLTVKALFSPEHGFRGNHRASESVDHLRAPIPVYSLHGATRRPTEEMLKEITLLIYDIQDIGVRSYTYASTLFFAMEEAAKRRIPLIVLDRPNPMGGTIVDGLPLEKEHRSFIGYLDIPYCHGMTIGELATYFNAEYNVECDLTVIPMKGWKRSMRFAQTSLPWTPTSPHIPEAETPLYYATTGIIGELGLVSIGIGYTLPFKVVGAPWIDSSAFAGKLNSQKLPGVRFAPFHFRPYYGRFKGEECNGVIIHITDQSTYRPVSTQYLLLGMLKSLYPDQISRLLAEIPQSKKELFIKANGTKTVLELLESSDYVVWKLIGLCRKPTDFIEKRKPYLLYE